MNKVGTMQGRLSPPVNGMIQGFPKDTWKDEFQIASDIGYDAIELTVDGWDNPLFDFNEVYAIRYWADKAGIAITAACAEFTVSNPLFGKSMTNSIYDVNRLVGACVKIGIPRVGISFEDSSAINTPEQRSQAIYAVKECVKVAERLGIILSLETSLSAVNVREFINRVGSPNLKVNFDLGNSCAYGEDTPKAIRSLGDLIGGIHIKDRIKLFGTTVPLGQGDVLFYRCFEAIKDIGYSGTLIIQGARGDDDIQTAKQYLSFVRSYLEVWNDNICL